MMAWMAGGYVPEGKTAAGARRRERYAPAGV